MSLCVGYSTWRGEKCSVRGWPEFRWAESILRSFTSQLPWQPDSFIKYNLHCFLSPLTFRLPGQSTTCALCRQRRRERKRERKRILDGGRRTILSLSFSLSLPSSFPHRRSLSSVGEPRSRDLGTGEPGSVPGFRKYFKTSVCAGFRWV